MNCKNGFHGSLGEELSPVVKGKPKRVCPECGRNKAHEVFLEACRGLGINPVVIDKNE